ncbi:MAG: hypothetical protein LRY76_05245 [Alphaproteobacteria bacterium]|nr:hypothetical protein [Alphaproteobacteria bacterium]
MSIIEKIPTFSDNQLVQLLSNALDTIARAKAGQKFFGSLDEAEKVVEAIAAEWERRLDLAQAGKYKAERPKIGILGFLGYRVGRNGASLGKRQAILSYIFTRQLPMLGSPAYMTEWATPNSSERMKKMATTIANLAREKIAFGQEQYADAILHWEADLDWLFKEYYEAKGYRFSWPRIRN